MYSVVNEINGTAFSSKLPGIQKMAGKTGTSQVRKISLEERREKMESLKMKIWYTSFEIIQFLHVTHPSTTLNLQWQ